MRSAWGTAFRSAFGQRAGPHVRQSQVRMSGSRMGDEQHHMPASRPGCRRPYGQAARVTSPPVTPAHLDARGGRVDAGGAQRGRRRAVRALAQRRCQQRRQVVQHDQRAVRRLLRPGWVRVGCGPWVHDSAVCGVACARRAERSRLGPPTVRFLRLGPAGACGSGVGAWRWGQTASCCARVEAGSRMWHSRVCDGPVAPSAPPGSGLCRMRPIACGTGSAGRLRGAGRGTCTSHSMYARPGAAPARSRAARSASASSVFSQCAPGARGRLSAAVRARGNNRAHRAVRGPITLAFGEIRRRLAAHARLLPARCAGAASVTLACRCLGHRQRMRRARFLHRRARSASCSPESRQSGGRPAGARAGAHRRTRARPGGGPYWAPPAAGAAAAGTWRPPRRPRQRPARGPRPSAPPPAPAAPPTRSPPRPTCRARAGLWPAARGRGAGGVRSPLESAPRGSPLPPGSTWLPQAWCL